MVLGVAVMVVVVVVGMGVICSEGRGGEEVQSGGAGATGEGRRVKVRVSEGGPWH